MGLYCYISLSCKRFFNALATSLLSDIHVQILSLSLRIAFSFLNDLSAFYILMKSNFFVFSFMVHAFVYLKVARISPPFFPRELYSLKFYG